MAIERCPYCGTNLKTTNFDRSFCPNCGIIDKESESSDEGTPSYIG